MFHSDSLGVVGSIGLSLFFCKGLEFGGLKGNLGIGMKLLKTLKAAVGFHMGLRVKVCFGEFKDFKIVGSSLSYCDAEGFAP